MKGKKEESLEERGWAAAEGSVTWKSPLDEDSAARLPSSCLCHVPLDFLAQNGGREDSMDGEGRELSKHAQREKTRSQGPRLPSTQPSMGCREPWEGSLTPRAA